MSLSQNDIIKKSQNKNKTKKRTQKPTTVDNEPMRSKTKEIILLNICQAKHFTKLPLMEKKKELVLFFPPSFLFDEQFIDACEHLFLFTPLHHCDVQCSPESQWVRISTDRGRFQHIISHSYFTASSVFLGCLCNQQREKSSLRGCFSEETQLNALNLSLQKRIYPLAIFGASENQIGSHVIHYIFILNVYE